MCVCEEAERPGVTPQIQPPSQTHTKIHRMGFIETNAMFCIDLVLLSVDKNYLDEQESNTHEQGNYQQCTHSVAYISRKLFSCECGSVDVQSIRMKKTREEAVSAVNNSFVCLPCVPCLHFHHPHYACHHRVLSSPPASGAIHSLPMRTTVSNGDIFQQISYPEKRGRIECFVPINLYPL